MDWADHRFSVLCWRCFNRPNLYIIPIECHYVRYKTRAIMKSEIFLLVTLKVNEFIYLAANLTVRFETDLEARGFSRK